ncbi:MAG: DUF3750 domain-containing protein [Sedimenticola thiotaurini]|uniref:DUF3750 domain-containing protein n=1 Tax=Sedimenticola thiotaurini TaxID=1543721 RepID=A0A558D5U9_9GAMM|nr:MAG: DUF3750 domain-containing protein [Sedimenticola thiotaurini]
MILLKQFSAFILIGVVLTGCTSGKDWRAASREPAGIAPDPSITSEAVLQVYGADAWGWRGRRGAPVMQIKQDVPDRYWFGERPKVIKEYRGEGVDALINAVEKAANSYPWKNRYTVFPGPNSNTFTAWIAKRVPELELELPLSAIGKSYVD